MGSFFGELKRRNVVRVGVAYIIVGWVVVQISQVLFEAFGTPDWVIKTVIVLIAIGFPFALLFAWAFEITPEGVKKTRDVDLSSSLTHSTGKKLNFFIMASLVIALAYFIWERQTLDRGVPNQTNVAAEQASEGTSPTIEVTETGPQSIAVLPFVNMSSDTEQEWFADGLTEEILNSLARTPDLLVAARTSSFSFKNSEIAIPEIAASLGVDHVLEGSVRRGGDTIRITAQLIRAADGFHLWSETFDRTMENIISIQEEIAIEIAKALQTAMDPEALKQMMSAGTNSVPAFEAYLNGIGIWRAAGASTDVYEVLNALEAFEKAVDLDPEFANAYLRLYWFWYGELETRQMFYGMTQFTREEKETKRDEALRNAIRFETDPVTKSYYRAHQVWRDRDLRRALRLMHEYRVARPSDETAIGSEIQLMRELGLHKELTEMIRTVVDSGNLTKDFADQALQGLRTVEDADLMRVLAQEAISRFGDDDSNLIYQSHRQLLWASDIDGASSLMPRIRNSQLLLDTQKIAELRQLCAEERTIDAKDLFARAIAEYPDDVSLKWLGLKIIGDDEAAEQMFLELDQQGDLDTIMSYLNYPHFDPKPFPNFMKSLEGQGMETRPVFELPYRCNR